MPPTQYTLPSHPVAHAQVTVGVTAVGLPSIPDRVRRILIRVVGQPVNWRDDGVDPTGTAGMPLLADESLVFDADPDTFRLIRAASATADADVRVAYYR